jgi:hypothetical protein
MLDPDGGENREYRILDRHVAYWHEPDMRGRPEDVCFRM